MLLVFLLAGLLLPPAAAVAAWENGEDGLAAVYNPDSHDLAGAEYEPAPAPMIEMPVHGEPVGPLLPPSFKPAPDPPPPTTSTPEPTLLSLAPAQVLVEVSSRQALVTAGEPFTVTMRVAPTGAAAPLGAGFTLGVRLPQDVTFVGAAAGPLRWQLPALAAGESVTQTLVLMAAGDSSLLGIEATVAGDTALPVTQALWLAVAAPVQAGALPAGPDAKSAGPIQEQATGADAAAVALVGVQGAVIGGGGRRVTLALGPGAAPVGAVVRFTPLFDWRSATHEPATPPVAEPTTTPTTPASETPPGSMRLYLPAISVPGLAASGKSTASRAQPELAPGAEPGAEDKPPVPSVQDSGIDFFALWTLDGQSRAATPSDGVMGESARQGASGDAGAEGEIETLVAEGLLLVDVADLAAAGVDPRRLQLWTREQAADPWQSLRAHYDEQAHVLRAWLPHFSQFGLGEGTAPSGDLLPSVQAFTVDALSGGMQAAIQIETPPGLGGLRPNLALHYSSVLMDDLYRTGGASKITAQAGAGGFGWNLSGISYIAALLPDKVLDDDTPFWDKRFALVLGGERVEIGYAGGKWQTNPATFARVEWQGGSSNGVRDFGPWTVTTPDGARYEFGDAGPYADYQQVSANAYSLEQTNGSTHASYRLARRWYLRKVTDTLGNSMEYRYRTERRYKTCQVEDSWVRNGWNWYTSSVDPVEIVWSANPAQGAPSYLMRTLFVYAAGPRSDTQVENSAAASCDAEYATQPLLGIYNQLSSLVVQVYSDNGWRTLRSYQLEQAQYPFSADGKTKARNYLTSVVEQGKDGAQRRRTSFSYIMSNVNGVWLTWVNNHLGGGVASGYGDYRVSCSASVCRNGMQRHPVTVQVAYNGAEASVRTEYSYGPTAEPGGEWGAVANDGGFLGFAEVQVTHFGNNSADPAAALQWERLRSVDGSTGVDAGRDNPDPRRGKLARRELWSRNPANGGLLLATTEYDWRAYWFLNGDWSTTPTQVSARKKSDGSLEYPPTVVQQEAMTVTTGSGPGSTVNVTRKYYESTAQNGLQYGNLTRVDEWADGRLLRTTLTEYYPNAAAHIVNLPARVRVFDSWATCVREERSSYDRYASAGNDFRLPPVRGLLSERALALVNCVHAGVIATDDPAWQIERFGYDAYGNQTTHHRLASTDGSVNRWTNTEYDAQYHLFPVRRYDAQQPQFAETAGYYGVNVLSSGELKNWNDPWGLWGAMAEWCDVNEVCIRAAYDAHGRRTLAWENVARGVGWSSQGEANAAVRWDYRDPLNNAGWNDVTVAEWRAPRCTGNFVRRHYNSFGQLTQEQRPDMGWCGSRAAVSAVWTRAISTTRAGSGCARSTTWRASAPSILLTATSRPAPAPACVTTALAGARSPCAAAAAWPFSTATRSAARSTPPTPAPQPSPAAATPPLAPSAATPAPCPPTSASRAKGKTPPGCIT